VPERAGSGSNTTSPRNAYATNDGGYVALSGSIQTMAERLFRVIGRDDMNNNPKFMTNADRVAHRAEVDEIVGGWIRNRTLDEVLEVFRREGITGGPIYNISQIVKDPHFKEREIIVDLPDEEMGQIPMHNVFPKLSATPGTFRRAAPNLGQDNEAILSEAGIG
jgi:crotonobetainyl-CoA:carnitine CoA-transferase CaiB-like acyl-CoA transferase